MAPLLGAPEVTVTGADACKEVRGFCAKGKKPAGTENKGPYATYDPVALKSPLNWFAQT